MHLSFSTSLLLLGFLTFCIIKMAHSDLPGSAPPYEPFNEDYLKKDTLVNGILYKKDTYVHYYDDEKKLTKKGILAKDTIIKGFKAKAGTEVIFDRYSGNLFKATAAENFEAMKVMFMKDKEVMFTEKGEIYSGYLLNNQIINSIEYKKGTLLGLYGEGRVVEGVIAKDTSFGKIKLPKETRVFFDGEVPITTADLNTGYTIQGIKFPAGTHIRFDDEGKIESFHCKKDFKINGVLYMGGLQLTHAPGAMNLQLPREIHLFENGKVWKGILAEDYKFMGILFKKESAIEFHYNGKVRCGVSAKDQEYKGRKIKISDYLEFNDKSELEN